MNETEIRLTAGVDRNLLMAYTEGIAQWVRLSGSPEEMESFRWVQSQLKAFGLTTTILHHDAYISLPGPASLQVDSVGAIEVITHAMARSGEGRAEIVYGDEADASGKILLIDGLATPGAVLAAQARGAQALLVINDANHHEMIVSPVWGSPTVEDLDRLPGIAALSMRYADGQRVKAALAAGPVFATYKATVETGWRKTPILVADLPGPDEEYVLFSGHLDSWHLGAMDNGSANAVMIEVARLMATVKQQLKRGLKVIFWSGHSHGRYSSSTWYADTHWQNLYDHCVAHVNIDSVGGKGATVLSEAMVHPELKGFGAEVIRQYTGAEYEGRRVNRSSDQSFCGIGIPSLWGAFSEQPPGQDTIGVTKLFGGKSGGLGWWWHTIHDTMDKVDPELLERDCKCYVAAVSRLLLSDRLPLDPAAAARTFRDELRAYADRASGRFDLTAALARADLLVSLTARLNTAPVDAQGFNRCATRVSRYLIPTEYTEAGSFGHDPALSVPPVPALRWIDRLMSTPPGSDEERFVLPLVTRGCNRVVYALNEAIREVEQCLSDRSQA